MTISLFGGNVSVSVRALAAFVVFAVIAASLAVLYWPKQKEAKVEAAASDLYGETAKKVLPAEGYKSGVKFGDSIVKLVEAGVIDGEKFKNLYLNRSGLTEAQLNLLISPSADPIAIDLRSANFYLNLLWPLGLANKMAINSQSPIAGDNLYNFASTGGWNLGKEESGGVYFNKVEAVKLTPEQEALVKEIADSVFRPCCSNSAWFQDCNHGSALLGFIMLAVSQGFPREQIYRDALALNSFWFPDTYIQTALYYNLAKKTDWENVNPKEVLSAAYSSSQGWQKTVKSALNQFPNLVPPTGSGSNCGA